MYRVKANEFNGKAPVYVDLDDCNPIVRGELTDDDGRNAKPVTVCYTSRRRPDGSQLVLYLVETPEELFGLPPVIPHIQYKPPGAAKKPAAKSKRRVKA